MLKTLEEVKLLKETKVTKVCGGERKHFGSKKKLKNYDKVRRVIVHGFMSTGRTKVRGGK